MTYTAAPAKSTGDAFSAAEYTTYIKNNFTALWPYTTAGDLSYATASNAKARLGIGSTSNVLTVVGGVPAWVAPSWIPLSTLTAAGDIITAGGSGIAGIVSIGSTGQVLTVSGGLPTWATPSWVTKATLSTTGDLLYASGASTPARLAIGSTGNVLTVSAGLPAWAAPSWITKATVTAAGDLIIGNGSASVTNLAIGTSGYVLQSNGTTPGWAAPSWVTKATLATTGDLLYASGASTPANLAIGSTGNVLTVAGGVPTWAAPSGNVLGIGRQGGNATNWLTTGTTNYSPSAYKIQMGTVDVTITSDNYGSTLVTFPTAFTNTPLVMVGIVGTGSGDYTAAGALFTKVSTANTSTARIGLQAQNIISSLTQTLTWLAIGE